MSIYKKLLITFIVLSVFDVVATYSVLEYHAFEQNPVMIAIWKYGGYISAVIFKGMMIALFIYITSYLYKTNRDVGLVIMAISVGALLTVSAGHIFTWYIKAEEASKKHATIAQSLICEYYLAKEEISITQEEIDAYEEIVWRIKKNVKKGILDDVNMVERNSLLEILKENGGM